MTKKERFIVTAYTGISMLSSTDEWAEYYDYIREMLAEDVIELGDIIGEDIHKKIQEKTQMDFYRLSVGVENEV